MVCKRLNNIFHSPFVHYPLRSQAYNKANLKKALDLQKTMKADMGGTEIFETLKDIFRNKPSTSHSRQVSFLNVHLDP